MSSSGQTWFVVFVLVVTVGGAFYTRTRNENERREMLELCFRSEPRLAAKFYSAKTPYEDKNAIVEGCLGPEHGAEVAQDVNHR